jgi:hypothetical protein
MRIFKPAILVIAVLVLASCAGPRVRGIAGMNGEGITELRFCHQLHTDNDVAAIYRQSGVWVWETLYDGAVYQLKKLDNPAMRLYAFPDRPQMQLELSGDLVSFRDYTNVPPGEAIKPTRIFKCE